MTKELKRVLIANRGEIAVRIARTLHEMGITPVAVFSDADRTAPHVRVCDLAVNLGPGPAPESYLKSDLILEVANRLGVDGIHPGYGFLSENAEFAEAVEAAGITWIGPPSDAIRRMGSKTEAREAMKAAKVPYVPGSEGALTDAAEAATVAAEVGYPVMLKASAGGGGKGMRMVDDEAGLDEALRAARSEAKNAFGDDAVYLEKVIVEPRHVEIQILSGPDSKTIWLGERECSMQRRHQKIIEETPSPVITDETRRQMGEVACRAAEAVGYVGAGTVEFLVDADLNFYFLEMNTRLQVEHPITELCCGLDLVEAQVRIARGEPLSWKQEDIQRRGHAIEARLYAEDPSRNFLPSPGRIDQLLLPDGPGVRVDSGVTSGFEVPRFYDPMIAKIAVWGPDRDSARRKLARALRETAVKGIKTNARFLRRLIDHETFRSGNYHTGTVADVLAEGPAQPTERITDAAVAAAALRRFFADKDAARRIVTSNTQGSRSDWRSVGWRLRGRA